MVLLPLGAVGRLRDCPYQGWYVLIQEGRSPLAEETDADWGFVVYQSRDPDFANDSVWWAWLPDRESLDRYVSAEHWIIDWLDEPLPLRFR